MIRLLRAVLAVALLSAVTYFVVPASFFTLTVFYVLAGLYFVFRGRRSNRQ